MNHRSSSFEGKLIFDQVQIKIVVGLCTVTGLVKNEETHYAFDGTEERIDNFCMWRCLAVHNRGDRK